MRHSLHLTWHWWGVGSGSKSGPWSSCGWDDGRAIRERTAWVVGVVLQFAGQWNLVQVGAPVQQMNYQILIINILFFF